MILYLSNYVIQEEYVNSKIFLNSSKFNDAPPIKTPSTFSSSIISLKLEDLTDPP